jgi:hypothetical protein
MVPEYLLDKNLILQNLNHLFFYLRLRILYHLYTNLPFIPIIGFYLVYLEIGWYLFIPEQYKALTFKQKPSRQFTNFLLGYLFFKNNILKTLNKRNEAPNIFVYLLNYSIILFI